MRELTAMLHFTALFPIIKCNEVRYKVLIAFISLSYVSCLIKYFLRRFMSNWQVAYILKYVPNEFLPNYNRNEYSHAGL